MVKFLAELKRRNVYRVGAAYAVVAWLLLQLIANLAPIFEMPAWFPRGVVMPLAIGFPVALIFAWVQEIAPSVERGPGWEDEKKSDPARADWILSGALVLVIAIFIYQQITLSTGERPETAPQAGQAGNAVTQTPKPRGISIAVLPFTNLSGDAAQEFFSDGMTEEITTALAKISDLSVIVRTSAYQFKDENKDLRAVGQMLGVTHIIEGSVRKAGSGHFQHQATRSDVQFSNPEGQPPAPDRDLQAGIPKSPLNREQ